MSLMNPNDVSAFPTTAYRPGHSTDDAEQTVISEGTSTSNGTPQLIPGYEMVKELGRGGMGVVYLARQSSLNRQVALKMVLAGQHASSSDLARFKTEAEAVAQLQHPHIVQVIETGEHQGTPWFSMEYVSGGSLDKRLQGRPLPPREAARITSMIAEAVAHAHARGVLHRDLKPANILVQDVEAHSSSVDSSVKPVRTVPSKGNTVVLDGIATPTGSGSQTPVTLKVTDFGLAKQLDDGRTLAGTKTQAGTVMGSPSYMAPEQASGDTAALGPTVDVYALGALLYELLTGRPPFRASTAWDTITQVLKDEPVPPTRLMPRLPRDIETICLKCLAKDPKKRYASVSELDADIQRFLRDEPIHARPIAWWERTWKAAKRRPTLAGLIVTAIVAVGIIIALISIGNAKLLEERIAAEDARDKAMVAMKKAEAEHKKAQKRLEMAVEAVEKLLTRTASESWARRPELQEERKKLLEDAVTFYQAFLEQESDDPLLRREAARVYYRMAGVYLLLGDAKSAAQTLQKTKELQEALCEQFPDIIEYRHDLVKTVNFLGNAEVMQGQYVTSRNMYEKAAKNAEALVQAFPENAEFKITLVRTLLSLYQFYSQGDANAAISYLKKAVELSKKLYETDPKPYLHQLTYLTSLIEQAQLNLNQNQPSEVKQLLEQIQPMLARMEKLEAPSVQDRDQYESLYARYTIIHGYSMVRSGMNEAGEEELRKGVAMLDNMLNHRPKHFPVRMLQMNALQTLGEVQDRQQKLDDARKTMERTFKLQDQMYKDMPHMAFLRGAGNQQRSELLILRAKEGTIKNYDRSAEDLLRSRQARDNLDVIYNVACGYSLASVHATPEIRERYAKRAVTLLNELFDKKYFTMPRILHLLVDADLVPLRDRDDFKAFVKRVSTVKKVIVQVEPASKK
jgi:serine/threonine protein kinase